LVRHHELFRKFAPLTKFRSQREDRIDICLENNIAVPGFVPTPQEATGMLKSEDWDQRLRASAMLVKMGNRAAPAETVLVSLFDDDEGGPGATVSRFRNNAVTVLGNIKTTKPRSLELLLEALDSRDYGVSQTATQAFIMIGAPAVPYLIRGLKSEAGGVQYKAASALSKIGPPARDALPLLRELAKSRNRDMHSMALKAIASIEGE
jgi:HEAT repeat protein